jgi:hypothetical protein
MIAIRPIGNCNLTTLRNTAIQTGAGRRMVDWSYRYQKETVKSGELHQKPAELSRSSSTVIF